VQYAVNFDAPDDVRQWLDALRAQVEELVDLGAEAARKKEERVVARVRVRVELERTGKVSGSCSERGAVAYLPTKRPAHH